MNTSERRVWGEPGMRKMTGGESASLISGRSSRLRCRVLATTSHLDLVVESLAQGLVYSKCSINGRIYKENEEKNIHSLNNTAHSFVYSAHLQWAPNMCRKLSQVLGIPQRDRLLVSWSQYFSGKRQMLHGMSGGDRVTVKNVAGQGLGRACQALGGWKERCATLNRKISKSSKGRWHLRKGLDEMREWANCYLEEGCPGREESKCENPEADTWGQSWVGESKPRSRWGLEVGAAGS